MVWRGDVYGGVERGEGYEVVGQSGHLKKVAEVGERKDGPSKGLAWGRGGGRVRRPGRCLSAGGNERGKVAVVCLCGQSESGEMYREHRQ